MTTPPFFPPLQGQVFPKRGLLWKGTRLIVASSGREVRGQNWAYPRHSFEVSYDILCSDSRNPAATARSWQMLLDLVNQVGGQSGTFLYIDPDDSTVTGQVLGVGDGTSVGFTFQRSLVNFLEPVGWVTSVENVYLNGVAQGSNWALSDPNTLVFSGAPASGQVVTADFHFAYLCRFDMDEFELAQFAVGMHAMSSLKFISVRSS